MYLSHGGDDHMGIASVSHVLAHGGDDRMGLASVSHVLAHGGDGSHGSCLCKPYTCSWRR